MRPSPLVVVLKDHLNKSTFHHQQQWQLQILVSLITEDAEANPKFQPIIASINKYSNFQIMAVLSWLHYRRECPICWDLVDCDCLFACLFLLFFVMCLWPFCLYDSCLLTVTPSFISGKLTTEVDNLSEYSNTRSVCKQCTRWSNKISNVYRMSFH